MWLDKRQSCTVIRGKEKRQSAQLDGEEDGHDLSKRKTSAQNNNNNNNKSWLETRQLGKLNQ